MNKFLETEGLYKEYNGVEILHNIDFELKEGEFTIFMGQSGCGKSTFLYSISGMDSATKGKIYFLDKDISKLSEEEMSKMRLEHMGFIFQTPNLLKNLSIKDNITFPAKQLKKVNSQELEQYAKQLMKQVGIENVADHDIRKVSGGQLQRAAICRALINKPKMLFGDEPTGALNSSTTREILDILDDIHKNGTTILIVTHDAKVAARADKVVYLEDGKIKDTILLGQYKECELKSREEKVALWLNKMGF